MLCSLLLAGTWVAATATHEPEGAAAPVTVVPVDPLPPAPRAVSPAALAVAVQWVAQWSVHPGTDRAQWIERLRPLTTDEFLGLLATDGDPDSAAHRVTGPATGLDAGDASAAVLVPTDVATVRVELVDAGGWRVADAGDDGP